MHAFVYKWHKLIRYLIFYSAHVNYGINFRPVWCNLDGVGKELSIRKQETSIKGTYIERILSGRCVYSNTRWTQKICCIKQSLCFSLCRLSAVSAQDVSRLNIKCTKGKGDGSRSMTSPDIKKVSDYSKQRASWAKVILSVWLDNTVRRLRCCFQQLRPTLLYV